MRILLVLSLLVAVLADPVPLNNCGGPNDPLVVNSANATPWPPVIGQALQVDVTATLSSAITAGTLEAKVVFDGIPLIDEKKDLCTLDPNITCPIAAQQFKISQSVTLPSFLPGGEYNITISGVDGGGNTIACYNLDVTLSSSSKKHSKDLKLDAPAQSREIVDFVNALGTTWTAGHNKRFTYNTLRHVKNLCGAKKGGPKLPVKRIPKKMALPTSFDPRDGSKWPACKASLNHVRDQGACGSCWAFGAAEAMTDRICIASNGQSNFYLSAEDLTSCCDSCGMGCDGGYPSAAWDYFQSTGIVTGGDWNTNQGCYPYQLQACDHHVTGKYQPCGDIQPTPACANSCQNNATWSSDKHFGASSYSVPSDQQSIMTEIYTNGPVEAAYDVYADFVSYKSGVYQHVTGDYLGGHAVKIIGWGVDGTTPYWIVANSWNNDWGNNGFFNILRGSDECGIEDGIVAGVPKVTSKKH